MKTLLKNTKIKLRIFNLMPIENQPIKINTKILSKIKLNDG